MKEAVNFDAMPRERSGKGAARALRRDNRVPAILYSKGETPVQLCVPEKELTYQYRKGGFFNTVVALKTDGKTYNAIPREVQLHPVTDRIEHVDFLMVTKDSKVRVMVPVHFLNQDKATGLKRGGVLNIVRHELELICLPSAIPANIEVDIISMDIGDSLHINDMKLPEGVTPAIKDRNFTVATIAGRQKEEEAPAAAAAATEGAAAATPAAGAADAKAPAKDEKKK